MHPLIWWHQRWLTGPSESPGTAPTTNQKSTVWSTGLYREPHNRYLPKTPKNLLCFNHTQVILVQYVSVNAALMLLGNNFYFQPPVCVGFLLFGCLITLQLDTVTLNERWPRWPAASRLHGVDVFLESETNMQKFVFLQLPGFAWIVNIVDLFIDGEADL